MSGNFSRYADRAARLYSRVSLVQGAMITDSDQREGQEVASRMVEGGDRLALGSGVPREGGVLAYSIDAGPPDIVSAESLRPGRVVADGRWGEVRATEGAPLASPLALLARQAGFLAAGQAPATGRFLVYADLWDRHVGPAEDGDLADPAFLGAETSVRSQRMVQLKLLDAGSFGDTDRALVEEGLPPCGDLRLVSAELTADTPVDDPCDPCAAAIAPEAESGNALVRIEVHRSPFATVQRDGAAANPVAPAGGDRRIVVKFGRDNGSLEVPGEAVQSLIDDPAFVDAVFEIASVAGEQVLGLATAPEVAREAELVDLAGLQAAAPAGLDGRILRVWDGAVSLDLNAPDLAPQPIGTRTATGSFDEDGALWRVSLRVLDLALVLEGQQRATGVPFILPGDAWTVATREFADDAGARVSFAPEPVAVDHRYAFVARIENRALVPETAETDMRSRRFPALTDLDAQSVAWSNHHHPEVGTNTVQGALDLLWAREPVEGGDCLCTFCLDPDVPLDEQFAEIADEIRNRDLPGVRLCLPAGRYVVQAAAGFGGIGHLTVQGAGREATEIVLADRASLTFGDCRAVTLSDLSIASEDRAGVDIVTVRGAQRVEVARCLLSVGDGPETDAASALLRVTLSQSDGAAAWITDNVLAIGRHRGAVGIAGGGHQVVSGNVVTGPGRPAFRGVLVLPELLDLIRFVPLPADVRPGAASGVFRVPGTEDQALDLTAFPVAEREAVFRFVSGSAGLLMASPLDNAETWDRYTATVAAGGLALEARRADATPARGRTTGRAALDSLRRAAPDRGDAALSATSRLAFSPTVTDILDTSAIMRSEIADLELPTLSDDRWTDFGGLLDDFRANVRVSVYRRAFGIVAEPGDLARVELRGNRFDWVHSAIVVRGGHVATTGPLMPPVGQVEIAGNHIRRIPIRDQSGALLERRIYPAAITCDDVGSATLRDNQVRHVFAAEDEAARYAGDYLNQVQRPEQEGFAAIELRGVLGPVLQAIGNEANYFRFAVYCDGRPAWDVQGGDGVSFFFGTVWTFRRNATLPALPGFAGVEIAGLPNVGRVRIIPFLPDGRNAEDDNHPPMFVNR